MEQPALREILTQSDVHRGRVLDLGCGDGRVYPTLMETGFDGADIVGVDIDPDMIAKAQAQYPTNEFQVADVTEGIYLDDRVDLVLSVHVLHYFDMQTLERIFRNMHDLTKVGGGLIFLVAHPVRWVADDLSRYFLRDERTIHTQWGTDLTLTCNTIEDYCEALFQAGYQIRRVLEPTPVAEGRDVDEKSYKKYSAMPSRLLVEAVRV